MGKISDLLTKFGRNNDENIMKQIAEHHKLKIKYSKVYKYWVCDYVTEPLKDIITPGNKYRIYRGEFPEEFYFIDDQGHRNDSPLMFYMGHFIKENDNGLQEIIVPWEARGAAFANGILLRAQELLKMWEVIENDLHEDDDTNDGLLKKDIEEALQEIKCRAKDTDPIKIFNK